MQCFYKKKNYTFDYFIQCKYFLFICSTLVNYNYIVIYIATMIMVYHDTTHIVIC